MFLVCLIIKSHICLYTRCKNVICDLCFSVCSKLYFIVDSKSSIWSCTLCIKLDVLYAQIVWFCNICDFAILAAGSWIIGYTAVAPLTFVFFQCLTLSKSIGNHIDSVSPWCQQHADMYRTPKVRLVVELCLFASKLTSLHATQQTPHAYWQDKITWRMVEVLWQR